MKLRSAIAAAAVPLALFAASVGAAPTNYNLDPSHTFPSFEADHMGISKWRGKFTKTSGTVTLDRAAKTGTIDVKIDAASLDFGHAKMTQHAKSPDMFDVEAYPDITYKGKFTKFNGDVPTEVEGELSLHGVTKPVKLEIRDFKCIPHPMLKREVCGADVHGSFNRADFGITYAINRGFSPEVKLAIQVEAVKAD
jgi:polyisoprenoid-binding protein YceI